MSAPTIEIPKQEIRDLRNTIDSLLERVDRLIEMRKAELAEAAR